MGTLGIGRFNESYCAEVGILARGRAIQIAWGLNAWFYAVIRKYGISMWLGSFSTEIR